MSITVEMSQEEIAAIKELTRTDNDAEAIRLAAQGYLRFVRSKELIDPAGRESMIDEDYDDSPWTREELEAVAWETINRNRAGDLEKHDDPQGKP